MTQPVTAVVAGEAELVRRTLGSFTTQTRPLDRVVVTGPDRDALAAMAADFVGLLDVAVAPTDHLAEPGGPADPRWVNAGDVWLPHHLERHAACLTGGARYVRRGDGLEIEGPSGVEPTVMTAPSRAADHVPARVPVSVIVPSYESAHMLATALGSVVAGSVQPAQVVVIDDGSTDNPAGIAERFGRLLPLRMVTKTNNEGLGAARRDAIEASDQPLIALLDADDYWLPDHLERLVAAHRGCRSIVTSQPLRWRPDIDEHGPHKIMAPRVPPPAQQRRSILAGNFLFIGSLFDRLTYDQAGGFAPRRRCEDWDLWIRMLLTGAVVHPSGAATVLYRRHSASLSAGSSGLLSDDLELLAEVRPTLEATADVRTITRAARGRRALLELAAGRELAAAGHSWAARRRFARAIWRDRSLRPTAPPSGSATVRGCVGVVSPRRLLAATSSGQD